LTPAAWLWIPITIAASLAQTARNAAQRHLTTSLGTLGSTLVRFLYGLPFAALWLLGVHVIGEYPLPAPNTAFFGWVVLAALSQIAATALLLQVMTQRNFSLGIAYSKSEVIQVAIFGLVFLGDPVTLTTATAIAFGTLGVLLLSPIDRKHPFSTLIAGWTTRPAMLGLLSGTAFGIAAVGYRGGALALEGVAFPMAAAYTLVAALALQTVLLVGWLLVRDAQIVARVCRAWRSSLFAGLMGATASIGWFTAMAIEPIAHVRTLALIELLFGYVVSRRIFRERVTGIEIIGMVLLTSGLIVVTLGR
jgi:drug/metabolite transporter (DMT)-like permease